MEIAKLVLEFVKALAWPSVVLAIALVFRTPLEAILRRISKVGLPGGVSIDFEEKILEAKALSEKVNDEARKLDHPEVATLPLTEANARMLSVGLRPTPSGLDISYYRNIANTDPNLALAGLRMELELLANNVADGFKLKPRKSEPLRALLSRLRVHGAITAEQAELAKSILALSNEAVHGRRISKVEAEDVIDAAAVLFQQYLNWLSWGWPDNWSPKGAGQHLASAQST